MEMDSGRGLDERGRVLPLVCPGAAGCERALARFQLGVALRDITPDVETYIDLDGNGRFDDGEPFADRNGNGRFDPTWLGGFGLGRAATGVHDRLWARAVSFRKGDLRVALVAIDLVGLFHDDVLRIRRAAADFDVDQVIVVATHNHEGPDTIGLWGPNIATTGRDDRYVDRVVTQSVSALEEAVRSELPARLELSRADASAYVADSRQPIVIEPEIVLARFVGPDRVVAQLAIWGNHPEVLGADNTLVTSDFAQPLRRTLEAAAPGSVAMFLPGT